MENHDELNFNLENYGYDTAALTELERIYQYAPKDNLKEEVRNLLMNYDGNISLELKTKLENILSKESDIDYFIQTVLNTATETVKKEENTIDYLKREVIEDIKNNEEISKDTKDVVIKAVEDRVFRVTNGRINVNYTEENKKYIEKTLAYLSNQENFNISFNNSNSNPKFSVFNNDKEVSDVMLYELASKIEDINISDVEINQMIPETTKLAKDFFDKAIGEEVDLKIGIKNIDGKEVVIVQTDDPLYKEKLKEAGFNINEHGNGIIPDNLDNKEILENLNKTFANKNELPIQENTAASINEEENDTLENANQCKSIIDTYKNVKPDGSIVRISVIKPEEAMNERFVEITVELPGDNTVLAISDKLHYKDGRTFDNNVLPVIAEDFVKEDRTQGNGIKENEDKPGLYSITSSNGDVVEFDGYSQLDIDKSKSLFEVDKELNLSDDNQNLNQDTINEEKEMEKPKTLVKINNKQNPSLLENQHGFAKVFNFILLISIQIMLVTFLVVKFLI